MNHFKHVIICMDDTARDAPMLRYMVPFLQKAHTEHVSLIHVHDPESDPHSTSVIAHTDEMVLVPVAPLADMTEYIRDAMYALAHSHLDPLPHLTWQVTLSDQPEVPEILSLAAKFDSDLIVIGRHYNESRFKTSLAVTARRVTEKATCSVLILPESIALGISHITVPVRNSACSATALQTAIDIAASFGGNVLALNIFRADLTGSAVPVDAHQRHLWTAAEKENQALFERLSKVSGDIPPNVEMRIVPCNTNDPVDAILSEIDRNQSDLVAIGARGRTGAAGILLGAVTEELIRRSPVPVLAVKTKGECIDLLHALLGLLKRETHSGVM